MMNGFYVLGIGVLIYLTWGTWWMALPLLVFVVSVLPRPRIGPRTLNITLGIDLVTLLLLLVAVAAQLLDAPQWLRIASAVLFSVYWIFEPRASLPVDVAKRRVEAHIGRFRRYGVKIFARRAGMLCRAALANLPENHADRPWFQDNLGHSLHLLFMRTGDKTALAEAVSAGRAAVAADPANGTYLMNLSLSLIMSCGAELEREVLDEALHVAREAVRVSEPGDVNLSSRMTNLGLCLFLLFVIEQDAAVLDESVQVARDSVAAMVPDDPDPSGYLITLSINLLLVYTSRGDLAALEEAVSVGRKAAAARSGTRLERSGNLGNLSSALFQLAGRRADRALLREAIKVCREAVAVTPWSHHNRPLLMVNLSQGLRILARSTDDSAAVREAVSVSKAALAATPVGSPGRSASLSGLGASLHELSLLTGDPVPLQRALKLCREAVRLMPTGAPARVACLTTFGEVSRSLFEQSGDPAHLLQAGHAFAEAAESGTQVLATLAAAQQAADLDLRQGDTAHAMAMVDLAVGLLPQVTSRQAGRVDRQHRITGFPGLASTAATAAISAEQPDRAVELLEQTRGLVLASSLDMRGETTALRAAAPELAREFDELRSMLEIADYAPPTPHSQPAEPAMHEALARRRADLEARWTQLLGRIRSRPGLAGFLVQPSMDGLRAQASGGPIIYVLAHHLSGHALIVTSDATQVVPLPEYTLKAAAEQADRLSTSLSNAADRMRSAAARSQAQQDVLELLGWLWDVAAEPVMCALGHTATTDHPPRLWWCPVGVSTLLPLHAAGRGDDAVANRVISSYTPTIRALGHARARRSGHSGRSLLVVAVPDAPGVPPLPGVTCEADLLRQLVPGATVLPAATHDAVAEALTRHRIAHFACHSFADLVDPSSSRLELTDGPLTVSELSRLQLGHGELAYLSACGTVGIDRRHADEAAHLTAAFQLAGYRAVVGTLWTINDHAAIAVAVGFYRALAHAGINESAAALHASVREQRAKFPAVPTRWAGHVHMGA
ncbi:hypothetical protein GCM10011609_35120 [Lentzea pudingi]|uniref:CHAT domain-containing protein n=2 Tax=Lentzea pudingi TaxID=1789439 RepID=A0ABQ2I070_9PSEU|nr:hypothetical protein GCM10011609_35120 [Lentzea pudingi]